MAEMLQSKSMNGSGHRHIPLSFNYVPLFKHYEWLNSKKVTMSMQDMIICFGLLIYIIILPVDILLF